MSKRVQYAQSLPELTSSPPAETGRVVMFAKPTGLHVRLADGAVHGPLGQQTSAVFIGADAPDTDLAPYLWVDTSGTDPTLWVST